MDKYFRPQIVVSRCLGFSSCRYDGQIIHDKFVSKLKEHVDCKTVCPETDIGLGIPREPIRLISENDKIILYQPATQKDITNKMTSYINETLKEFEEIDGFILKSRSPSCGIKDTKIYLGKENTVGSIKGSGMFAKEVLEKYPYLPIEDEGRLTNLKVRENFLTKIYANATLRNIKKTNSMAELVKFHSENKYLLMAYNQKEQKILGRIVANHNKNKFEEVIDEYILHIGSAMLRTPKYTNYINALMHIFGYFSEELSSKEKEFVLDNFEKYRANKIHLSVIVNVLHSYAIKYENEYLLSQTIWEPYPEALLDISDTGK